MPLGRAIDEVAIHVRKRNLTHRTKKPPTKDKKHRADLQSESSSISRMPTNYDLNLRNDLSSSVMKSKVLFTPYVSYHDVDNHKNMYHLLSKIILIGLLSSSFNNVFSQTDTLKKDQVVIIKMKNGDEYKGVLSKKDNGKILLKTINGEFNLIALNVRSIVNHDYVGKFEFANPHDTRYFFGPTGIPIKKGKGYYQNILVTTNFFNYGITENISIGGGFEFISTVLGSPIWFLTPKVGFDISENIHVGGGFIMAGFADEGTATLGYGVFTLGQSETNLSIGAGYGLIDRELSDYPAIMISGTHRISKSIALLSENYVIPNSFYFGIHGIRILSKKNSFDIGAIVIPEIRVVIPALPYVGYVRVF